MDLSTTLRPAITFSLMSVKVWPLLRSIGICWPPMAILCLIWFDHIKKMLSLSPHSTSMGAATGKPLVDFRGVSIDWGYQIRCQNKSTSTNQPTCELSESWFGSLLGGTFSEFSALPSLPSQLILNLVTLAQRGYVVRGWDKCKFCVYNPDIKL